MLVMIFNSNPSAAAGSLMDDFLCALDRPGFI